MTRNRKNNIVGGIILAMLSLFLLTMYTTDFITGTKLNVNHVIGMVLVVVAWFQFITWGSDKKVQKDEMGKKIATNSAKVSYYILTISLFLLWILDRMVFLRKNDFGNISLFAALCLALVVFPVVQFFSARRYK
ncbi:hypothetical protein ACU3L3_14130 [Priestia endophytica]|uniref:DUF2178 domain-containing protein n=1 Tax=Priestia endophytica DSM 13796 TaxID=1121089 RepID=A0A1I6BUX4_9BACI|nr:hypothetical protein [Priestia endophytica]KYG30793.1 hypothetical protein AZF06_23690 [Priestia endophytica]SFQ84726.1 hypothetical protein SAMN02745910_04265 [Priestia endophytica DSM 13796]